MTPRHNYHYYNPNSRTTTYKSLRVPQTKTIPTASHGPLLSRPNEASTTTDCDETAESIDSSEHWLGIATGFRRNPLYGSVTVNCYGPRILVNYTTAALTR